MGGTLFQAATIQSLMMGNYYGFLPLGELTAHGDTGMGTFDGLDGEMIMLDGTVYQALADGTIATPSAEVTSPFCCAADFKADYAGDIRDAGSFKELCPMLNDIFPENEKNFFHMAKITGRFSTLRLRSVGRQSEPYVGIDGAMAVAQQKFTLENAEGTAVALRCPNYMDRVNVAGWHMHFITADRKRGGHILGLSVESARAEIRTLDRYEMVMPHNGLFGGLDLTAVSNETVARAESK